ncbi:MAG TPA: flagellar protein FliT [Burkholderiaceae bacterium]|nr:flagellar protein FliT [Burkholderiaceae bacterium]
MQDTLPKLCPYELIAGITRLMRTLAQQDDWDAVVQLAPRYHNAVQELRGIGTLTPEELTARRGLLTEIIANDAELRRLAAPRLDELGTLITNLQRQRSVLRAYYTPQTRA